MNVVEAFSRFTDEDRELPILKFDKGELRVDSLTANLKKYWQRALHGKN